MANVFKRIWKGLTLRPESSDSTTQLGDLQARSDLNKVVLNDGSTASPIVTESQTATLTAKTIDAGSNTISNLTNSNLSGTAGITDANLATISTAGKVSNSATTATDANTASAIVARDSSGNFTAGTITANLTGTASNVTTNANLTGPITSSGNTTSVAAQTGTGSTFVMQASPTLTTPNIGAATGTSLNVTGQLTSTVSTGTAPLVVSSTTQVANLNAATAGTAGSLSGVNTPDHGGTGVANNAASTLTISGNFPITATVTNTTAITLPTAGTLATLAGTETLTNKTIGDALTSTQIATPATPSAGFSKIYSKSDGFFYQLDPNGTERKIGTGSGGINYITNGDAEGSTTGWATFSNTAANIPSNGTGGTATGLTFSRSTSSPLIGTASFSMVQANSTSLQGKGVSYDFTIDSAYQAQPLSISFNYNASSTFVASNGTTAPLNDGTTTTNAGNSDIEVFMYDKTNSVLIPVSPQVMTANGPNNAIFNGIFQTSSNSTSYRLILHVATTSANATGWTFKYDNVVVGPQQTVQGFSGLDSTPYTPTFGGLGTVSGVSVVWSKIGENLRVVGTATAGTTTASSISITLPSGLAIDYTKPIVSTGVIKLGDMNRFSSGGTYPNNSVGPWAVFADGTTTGSVFISGNTSAVTGTAFVKANGSALINTSDGVFFDFQVPISGWSSNVQMSNGADTRVVEAAYYTSSNTSTSSNTQINYDTKLNDTHSAVTTGAGTWKFTAPVSGIYNVGGILNQSSSGTGANFQIWKNGVDYIFHGFHSSTLGWCSTNTDVNLVAGDYIDIRPTGTVTMGGGALNTSSPCTIFIKRISGPATIAASDSVNAKYYSSANGTASTTQMINFDTKIYDSHSAVTSAGTGNVNWKYSVPIAGKYRITILLNNNAAPSGTVSPAVYKNGSNQEPVGFLPAAGAAGNFTTTLSFLAGDFFDIRANQNNYPWLGASYPQVNYAASPCVINIERVGN